ncbi:type II toxin-antitoxin system HicA family toxin [bacterium]|nr:type II toxin-antitoxin system HicA family toxin [bacterium]MBU1024510.1 type II toxin-antitoxin system HicA family toxin [bacterium]
MTKMPDITGRKLIRALKRDGWTVKSQKGSHFKLVKEGYRNFVVVPVHSGLTIPKGTLAIILRGAGLSVDELVNLLKKGH